MTNPAETAPSDVTDPMARCARCGERAIEHDFRDRTHLCAGTDDPFVSHELKRGCCMSDMSQPHARGCSSWRPPAKLSVSDAPGHTAQGNPATDEPPPADLARKEGL